MIYFSATSTTTNGTSPGYTESQYTQPTDHDKQSTESQYTPIDTKQPNTESQYTPIDTKQPNTEPVYAEIIE